MVLHTTAEKCWMPIKKKRQNAWYCWAICSIMAREMIFQKEYAPKEVIAMLNPLKDQIYAVRGNCDTEVDQMVLNFPVMADYCILAIDGLTFLCHTWTCL